MHQQFSCISDNSTAMVLKSARSLRAVARAKRKETVIFEPNKRCRKVQNECTQNGSEDESSGVDMWSRDEREQSIGSDDQDGSSHNEESMTSMLRAHVAMKTICFLMILMMMNNHR